MTPLQNDTHKHQCEANDQKCRIPRGGERSPDSESARRQLSKPGTASYVGQQKCVFLGNSGGGTTAGGTNVHPGPAKPQPVYYKSIIENPLSMALLGEQRRGSQGNGKQKKTRVRNMSMIHRKTKNEKYM
jgi:hypothetical protein